MTATVFPPNSPEPPPEIRVVRCDENAQLYERTEFNLWSNRVWKGAYLWDELNRQGNFRCGPETFKGMGYELTEVEEFTTGPVIA